MEIIEDLEGKAHTPKGLMELDGIENIIDRIEKLEKHLDKL